MFSTISSIRKPNKTFNMYHLEGSEIHISAVKVKLFIDNLENEVDGNLHLCSRSLFFEPADVSKPVFKLKFSNPLVYSVAEKTDKLKLRSTIISELKEQGLGPNEKKSFFISLEKLYGKPAESQIIQPTSARGKTERVINALVITAEKLFTTLRDPITPYSSERVNVPLIFELLRENSVPHVNKFLKLLDYVVKNKNEDNLVKVVIESQLNEALKEHKDALETKKENPEQQAYAVKARRVLPEGVVYGIVTLLESEGLVFYPVINRIHHKNLEIKFSKIKGMIRYRYMFKHSAIEIWSYNTKYSVLLDFYDNSTRETVFNYLKKLSTKRQENLFSRDYVTGLWLNGHLSNFEYLMFLNTLGNRSFNDLSQYPIFPWVISDFHSEKLNLNDPETFRDLSRPIGAINKSRLQRFKDGYEDQIKSKFQEIPYLYPTHYSTPGFVVYFLIRKIPEFIIRLQNGVFGPAERIFRSFESAWDMTVNQGPDLKELIPEFYFIDSDFLVNFDKILLGVTAEGELIDDVVLPVWAKNPSDFLQKMRAGLESDYVSSNLHHWIDLIFGYKQKGEQAIAGNNLFYPLCYEENVDWPKYKSSYEREAVEIQVAEFGQVPAQVFDFAHPPKRTRLINIYKIPKEVYQDDKEMLRARIHGATQEVDKLKGEIEYLKHHYTEALRNQGEDARKKEETKSKEFAKKLNEKQEELEALKRDYEGPRERRSQNNELEEAVAKVRREYEEKIERMQSKSERNDQMKELEKANVALKKKLKQYEEILQVLPQKEQSGSAGIKAKRGLDNFTDI